MGTEYRYLAHTYALALEHAQTHNTSLRQQYLPDSEVELETAAMLLPPALRMMSDGETQQWPF